MVKNLSHLLDQNIYIVIMHSSPSITKALTQIVRVIIIIFLKKKKNTVARIHLIQ